MVAHPLSTSSPISRQILFSRRDKNCFHCKSQSSSRVVSVTLAMAGATEAKVAVAPAIIVGGGRVGKALLDLGNGNDLLVKRGESVPVDFAGPILVATRNDDLEGVLEATPRSRWSDLVFFQNGMLEPWLESKGLKDADQVLAYFTVSKLGEAPVDGKTDTNPEGLTAAYGKWASAVAARLKAGGLSCKVLDKEAFEKQMLEKLIWISAFMLVGARHPGATVGIVKKEYRYEVSSLISELASAVAAEKGIVFQEAMEERLCAYSRAVAHFSTAVKEFKWRNGWFYSLSEKAIAEGKPDPCPLHTSWLNELKVLKLSIPNIETPEIKKYKGAKMELFITQPDDWHLHLRDGELLRAIMPHSSKVFRRAIVMPNLRPPITTTAAAIAYRDSIMKSMPENSDFNPLMTLYLTDNTAPKEIKLARKSGVVYAVKLYPAGATTNSQDGVTDLLGKCFPIFREMVEQNMPLLVHGEVTDPEVDIFDREKVFIDKVLRPLVQKLPLLKVVMEHITTADAVRFIESCNLGNVAATVTPQHLLFNRNSLFQGGLQPHKYCLPVLKREIHRQALVAAVTSGSKRYFLGTDSAPHERRTKESSCGCAGIFNSPVALSLYAKIFEEADAIDKLEAFTSFNGPDFYGLPRNSRKMKLSKKPWKVPSSFSYTLGDIIPMCAGETLEWSPSF